MSTYVTQVLEVYLVDRLTTLLGDNRYLYIMVDAVLVKPQTFVLACPVYTTVYACMPFTQMREVHGLAVWLNTMPERGTVSLGRKAVQVPQNKPEHT